MLLVRRVCSEQLLDSSGWLLLYRELAASRPNRMSASHTSHHHQVGPLGIALPPPISFAGARGGRVTVSVRRGLYHECEDLPRPDLAIAPNAGLAVSGYLERWPAPPLV